MYPFLPAHKTWQNLAKRGKTWVGNTGMHNGDLSRQ